MNIGYLNTLLPKGYYGVFVPADDESVDDEYAVRTPSGAETGVALQLCSGGWLAVTRWDEAEGSSRMWPMRQFDQRLLLRADFADALGVSRETESN